VSGLASSTRTGSLVAFSLPLVSLVDRACFASFVACACASAAMSSGPRTNASMAAAPARALALEAAPVLPAIDAPRDLGEVARVRQFVEALALPEHSGNGKGNLGRRGLVRVAHQVQPHQVAEGLVVGAPGDLDRPAPLEAPAVARLCIAQPAREVAGRLVALLRGGRPPDFLHELQLARLVRQLRKKGGHAQGRGDAVCIQGVVQWWQEQRTPTLRRVAHDLRQLKIGWHQRAPSGDVMSQATPRMPLLRSH
jgi:hypothetical protein